MDVMLQEHDAKLVLPIPEGLRELSSDIVREVLRSQPNNIFEFISEYTFALLETRDKAREAAIIVHDILESGLTYEAMLARRGISLELANRAATIIQTCFRGYIERKRALELLPKEYVFDVIEYMDSLNLPYEVIHAAATTIQAAFKGYKVRKMKREKAPGVSDSILDFLVETGITLDEANAAAVVIQRGYRATLERRQAQQRKGSDESLDDDEAPIRPEQEGGTAVDIETNAGGDQVTDDTEGDQAGTVTPRSVKTEAPPDEEDDTKPQISEPPTEDEGEDGETSPETSMASPEPTVTGDATSPEMTTEDETSPETSMASPEPTVTTEATSDPGDTTADEMGEDGEEE